MPKRPPPKPPTHKQLLETAQLNKLSAETTLISAKAYRERQISHLLEALTLSIHKLVDKALEK